MWISFIITDSFKSISLSVIRGCTKDQTECAENTQPLPQRNQHPYSAKAYGWENPFEGGAGMVPLRRRGERSLKPSLFCLAGAKKACFLNPKAGANGFLNTQPDLFLKPCTAQKLRCFSGIVIPFISDIRKLRESVLKMFFALNIFNRSARLSEALIFPETEKVPTQ